MPLITLGRHLTLLLFVWVGQTGKIGAMSESLSRAKRNLMDLCGMIGCKTGQSCVNYNHYGCFCGKGGYGVPIDGLDKCCQDHDNCYAHYPACWPKWSRYAWECQNATEPACVGNLPDTCYDQICRCDLVFAKCVAQFPYPERQKPCPVPETLLYTPDYSPPKWIQDDSVDNHAAAVDLEANDDGTVLSTAEKSSIKVNNSSDNNGGSSSSSSSNRNNVSSFGRDRRSNQQEGGKSSTTKAANSCLKCAGGHWKNTLYCYTELLICSLSSAIGG